MKFLHLAYRDTSGVPGRWAAAHREAGHEAELLLELEHPFEYGAPATVTRWSTGTPDERKEATSRLLEWADAIVAYDHPLYLETAIATGKPVLFRALGQSSREFFAELRALLAHPNVVRASAGTVDLALLLGVELAGAPYPLPTPSPMTLELVLCHAPSDREAKGTERVLRAAEAAGWEVDLVEDAPNALTLARKREAALVVDTCGPGAIPDGYGVNAVEAMALGLPVVSSASDPVRMALKSIGSPVALVDGEEALADVLEALKDARLRWVLGDAGRSFVWRFHSPYLRAHEDARAIYAARGRVVSA